MSLQQETATTSATRDLSGDALIQEVVDSFGGASPERFRVVMQSLVRHLHAFAKDVQLTEDEWLAGIQFLTRVGQTCTDTRQEMIMFSDTLGLSMQVIGINHPATDGSTESTVFGPFYVGGAPTYKNGDDIANGAPGEPCYMSGIVRSTSGAPIPGAILDIWQADSDGLYDVQRPELEAAQARGKLAADDQGRYWFWTVKPEAYGIPTDGPVGELIRGANRSPMRPGHVHAMVSAPGYKTVTTHVFLSGDQYLDNDVVFGVKQSLVGEFVRQEPGTAPDGRTLETPFYVAEFDFTLSPESTNGTSTNGHA